MIGVREQEQIFIEISDKLNKRISVWAIGGTAMIFLGLKDITLDIDLVFESEKDRKLFKNAAMKVAGYEDFDAKLIYRDAENLPYVISLPDSRIDLFLDKIILSNFSDVMKERAKEVHQFGENLFIKVADPHDIIILKSATSRGKDIEDIISIIKNTDMKWDILVSEAANQIKLGNETAILNLGEKLEKIRDKHEIPVPKSVLNNLWRILKKQADEKMRG